jgi:hypothetical protein
MALQIAARIAAPAERVVPILENVGARGFRPEVVRLGVIHDEVEALRLGAAAVLGLLVATVGP